MCNAICREVHAILLGAVVHCLDEINGLLFLAHVGRQARTTNDMEIEIVEKLIMRAYSMACVHVLEKQS